MYADLLREAQNPCLLFSGGADSQELLEWMLGIRKTPVVTFNKNFTKEQWAVIEVTILEHDLEAYTYPPSQSYLIPNGEELARVDVYNLGGVKFPVLRDTVFSERCGLDLDETKLDVVPFDFDVVFIGTRQTDHSEATGQPMKTDVMDMGRWKLVAPLFYEPKSSTAEVDTGNLEACHACVKNGTTDKVYCPKEGKEINGHSWDRNAMLSHFRQSFGF